MPKTKAKPKPQTPRRKLILKNGYAAGDIVMLTAAVRDLHACYPNQFLTDVRTPCAELWQHNPHITPLEEKAKGVEVIDCKADLIERSNQTPSHYLQAYSEYLNSRLGLQIRPAAFHGDIHLSILEKSWYSQVHELTGEDTPFWIIVAGGKRDVTVKWWAADRFQEVVNHFQNRIQFVQVGELRDHHPPLQGVIDLRGKTDLRQLVRLVYHSQGVLCGVTCAMHLAAAVERKDNGKHDRPCVVVAGGREPPHWEAYPAHQFIHSIGAVPCSGGGCWRSRVKPLGDGDERDLSENLCSNVAGDLPRCMDLITPRDVIRRIESYFDGGAAQYLSPDQAKAASLANAPSRVPVVPIELNPARSFLLPLADQPRLNGAPPPAPSSNPPQVTLVTLNDAAMASVARITSSRLQEYARRHHYPLFHYKTLFDPSRHPSWNKLLAVRHALLARQSEWVMWLDADAIIMNLEFPAGALPLDSADLICASDHNGVNMGIFLIRHSDWSLRFLDAIYFLGELPADPDGYPALWEQSTVKHLLRSFPQIAARTRLLPQQILNSSLDTYQPGDFILHLSGRSNAERLEILNRLDFTQINPLPPLSQRPQ